MKPKQHWRRVALGILTAVSLTSPRSAAAGVKPVQECLSRSWKLSAVGSEADRDIALRLAAAGLQAHGGQVALATRASLPDGSPLGEPEDCEVVLRISVERRGNQAVVQLDERGGAGTSVTTTVPLLDGFRVERSAPDVAEAVQESLLAADLGLPDSIPAVALIPPLPCDGSRPAAVRALLVGVNQYGVGNPIRVSNLSGSVRDVELLDRALRARYPDAAIRTLLDAQGSVAGLRHALTQLVEDTRCGDLVFFHFSGFASNGPLANPGVGNALKAGQAGGFSLVGADGALLGEATLRGFVTALRNRRALVIVVLDTNLAFGLRLGTPWRWPPSSEEVELLRGAGGYAFLGAGEQALEQKGSDGTTSGQFSLATAVALASTPVPTVRALAQAIDKHMRESRVGPPFFEASDPDAPIVFASPSAKGPRQLEFELDSEKKTDGGLSVGSNSAKTTFALTGKLESGADLWALLVNGVQATLEPGGRFKVELELRPGLQKVQFAAFYRDLSMGTAVREFQVGENADVPRGRRYALVIGIQRYDKWTWLKTPTADAEAVAGVLSQKYGFETSLQAWGSLLLKDPDKFTIGSAFSALRKALGPNDSLLIYFAGHGKAEGKMKRGFWIPRDGDTDNRSTWYSGDELVAEIADMQARHVLVISDSCFSGDLTRDRPTMPKILTDVERRSLIAERGARKSRLLITSGFDEPVLDSGGRGHSVFAQALVDGLESFPDDEFMSFELYSRFIYEQVGGKAKQQPQHVMLTRSEHDGGDLVFQRRLVTSP